VLRVPTVYYILNLKVKKIVGKAKNYKLLCLYLYIRAINKKIQNFYHIISSSLLLPLNCIKLGVRQITFYLCYRTGVTLESYNSTVSVP